MACGPESAPARSAPPPADLIVTNAAVYTVNPRQPRAEAVAVRGGTIAAVGSAAEIAALRGAATQVIDAGGRLVLPGLTDTHVHFIGGALGRQRVMLDDAATVAEVQRRVKAYADAHPDRAVDPRRRLVLLAVRRRRRCPIAGCSTRSSPIGRCILSAYDGHSSWANSKALELAGITRATRRPGQRRHRPRSAHARGHRGA